MTLDEILDAGFDLSKYEESTIEHEFDPKFVRVRCSQCSATVINNVPCHETGCPNARPEPDDDLPFDFGDSHDLYDEASDERSYGDPFEEDDE